ncbi:hypothetical protein [Comamonas sp. JC664]|uniref:hypothetical protein n=1 Tax=Comamonas sp. JC664 TaxID=2801917 RepID=UPI00361751F1
MLKLSTRPATGSPWPLTSLTRITSAKAVPTTADWPPPASTCRFQHRRRYSGVRQCKPHAVCHTACTGQHLEAAFGVVGREQGALAKPLASVCTSACKARLQRGTGTAGRQLETNAVVCHAQALAIHQFDGKRLRKGSAHMGRLAAAATPSSWSTCTGCAVLVSANVASPETLPL